MQSFPDMAEAHAWTLQRLREMAGRLTEQAYLRASEAGAGDPDPEAQARWMLVFDRMARGLRLSIALEARLSRERRWDADEIVSRARRAADSQPAAEPRETRWRGAPSPDAESEPCESDRERDDDGLPQDAPIGRRIARLKAIVEAAGHETTPRLFRFVAGPDIPPGEPWDLLSPADPAKRAKGAEGTDPPWRGSG
jgi:hypothetical protein